MKVSRGILVAVVSALLLAPAPLSAGVVRTLDGRLEGDVNFADGRIDVDGKSVPWDAVLRVFPHVGAAPRAVSAAVRFVSGEIWRGDILGLSAGKLSVRFGRFGTQEVDAGQVANVEFSWAPWAGGWSAGLHREKGEPVPGTLLWIDETRLAIDSPLGVLTLPREGAIRYCFPSPPYVPQPKVFDEVGLADGSVLRGKARPVAGGVQLEHPVLGSLNIEARQVRFIAQHSGRAIALTSCPQRSIEATGLVTARTARPVEYGTAAEGSPRTPACLVAMRVQPKTVVRYTVPPEAAGKSILVARVVPVEGARGEVRVRVMVGGKRIFDKGLAPDSGPLALRVPLPQGDELALEVDFGRRIGFPCGAVFEDPMLIRR